MIPFFVADRPISLSIIKGMTLPPNGTVGILTQAVTTTDNFKALYKTYPRGTEVVYPNGQPADAEIARRTVKMVDSGIFCKGGCHLSYADLFREYDRMGADYGVIIDSMGNMPETVKSAKLAMREYAKSHRRFKLVGVTQGRTADEYCECYEKLEHIGYEHIAVGGLLKKREKSARYVTVHSEEFLKGVAITKAGYLTMKSETR